PLGTEGEGLPGAPRAGTCKINVNTAPLRVLQCLDGMTEEAAQAIVAMRQQLAPEDLKNPSWPAQTGLVPAAVQSRLTTKATRFRVEILGYGDHTKVACRYEWLIELRGKVAQVLWQKDLTGLGFGWPVDDDSYIVRQ
ncbi:MAG: type II secretion system protein GspK, partial [Planctomycetota bacterium]